MLSPRLLPASLPFPSHIPGINHQILVSCAGNTRNKVMKRGGRLEPCSVLAGWEEEHTDTLGLFLIYRLISF